MSTQNQKVAIVSGASQGIGAALVEGYRKLGYAVVADSPLPSTNPYHVTPPTTYPHDPDKAKSLLAEADPSNLA